MTPYYRLAAIVLGSHCIRWASEQLYHQQCAGFISSIFAYGSPTCQSLRWIADTVTTRSIAVVTPLIAGLFKTLEA